jgi:hypothetical protein
VKTVRSLVVLLFKGENRGLTECLLQEGDGLSGSLKGEEIVYPYREGFCSNESVD